MKNIGRRLSPQQKHKHHKIYVEQTFSLPHKFVMKCADCNGKHIQWLKEWEYLAIVEMLKEDKK